jgi:hypothetical protein
MLHYRNTRLEGCLSQLRCHENRLIPPAGWTPTGLGRPTPRAQGWSGSPTVFDGDIRQRVRRLTGLRTTAVGHCFHFKYTFHIGIVSIPAGRGFLETNLINFVGFNNGGVSLSAGIPIPNVSASIGPRLLIKSAYPASDSGTKSTHRPGLESKLGPFHSAARNSHLFSSAPEITPTSEVGL